MHDTSYGNVDKFMQSGFVVDDVEAMRGVERRWEAMRSKAGMKWTFKVYFFGIKLFDLSVLSVNIQFVKQIKHYG